MIGDVCCPSTAHILVTQLSSSDWHSKLDHISLPIGAKVVRSNDMPLNKIASIVLITSKGIVLIFCFLLYGHFLRNCVIMNVTSCH